MEKVTTSEKQVEEFRQEIRERLRRRVVGVVEELLEEELERVLRCGPYERAEDRRGYRNGGELRRVTGVDPIFRTKTGLS